MRLQGDAARTEVGKCANCGEAKMPHRVCESCGHYGGSAVIEVAQEAFDE